MVFFMKKAISFTLLFGVISAFATDYNAMSTDKLMSLRGNVPVEDIGVYGTELTKIVKIMDEHDLEKYGILHLLEGRRSVSGVECNCNASKNKSQL